MNTKPQFFEQPYIKPIMKLKGSIRLFLEGSEDGLQRLADLHQSGELQGLLNELKPDDMPEIVVTKAEFTTDARVIEIGFRLQLLGYLLSQATPKQLKTDAKLFILSIASNLHIQGLTYNSNVPN